MLRRAASQSLGETLARIMREARRFAHTRPLARGMRVPAGFDTLLRSSLKTNAGLVVSSAERLILSGGPESRPAGRAIHDPFMTSPGYTRVENREPGLLLLSPGMCDTVFPTGSRVARASGGLDWCEPEGRGMGRTAGLASRPEVYHTSGILPAGLRLPAGSLPLRVAWCAPASPRAPPAV